MLGAGSTAIGASALVGSGAFTSVTSTRTVSVQSANDKNAYLGLKPHPESPNSSYVDLDEKGHLRIQMDEANPNLEDKDLGTGVNSNSITIFKDLFRIKNQGKQPIYVFAFLLGPKATRVGLFNGSGKECWGIKLDVGEHDDIGLMTNTHGIKAGSQLVTDMFIVAVGETNPEDGETHEEAAEAYVPDDAESNEELPEDSY